MARSFLRRAIAFPKSTNRLYFSQFCNFYSEALEILEPGSESKPQSISNKLINGETGTTSVSENQRYGETGSTSVSASNPCNLHLSPLFPTIRDKSKGLNIELVDSDLWLVSPGLANALRATDLEESTHSSNMIRNSPSNLEETPNSSNREGNSFPDLQEFPNFDEIEHMRFHGNLFYKLDRDSREFEEYNVRFHGKKSSKKNKGKEAQIKVGRERSKQENPNLMSQISSSELVTDKTHSSVQETSNFCLETKRQRTPTYNQLTDPYHQPFCLDIYISKSSVRACIVHRVTSKVVAVAHSISKDMKRELASSKDYIACAAVGGVLAQRAIADDIHNAVYTPRKGEKVEGKLKTVLQSVIDHGVDVKVKIKQRRPTKVLRHLSDGDKAGQRLDAD